MTHRGCGPRLLAWLQDQAALLTPGALAALALMLPAWRYLVLWDAGPQEIFFELRDGFLYLGDIPTFIAIGAWLLTPFPRRIGRLPRWLVVTLVMLALLASASALWAPLRSLALYQAARLWLLLAVFLVVATLPEARGPLTWGLLASGAIQAVIGTAQFLLQRTLGLRDLGEIVMRPEWSGASVITVNGVPTLRAYGLTQHPNLLGGFLMVVTLIGIGLVLEISRAEGPARRFGRTAVAVLLTTLCFGGLLLTFSRAAWLGTAIGGLIMLALLLAGAARTRVAWPAGGVLLAALGAVGIVFLATQWPLLRPRLGLAVEGVEIRSTDERAGLEGGAWALIQEHPWLGVGYGNFAIALWELKPPAMAAYPIYQPVHRVPLLAAAELGLPGGLLWAALALGPWVALWRHRRSWPASVLPAGLAAALAALTVVSWFDFYPWFSQQGRLLMWVCWGLWAQSMVKKT